MLDGLWIMPHGDNRTATECINARNKRCDSELIRDGPEEELIEELALIAEIRAVYNGTLNEINAQQGENRAARDRLESDWSEKKSAYAIDSASGALHNKSRDTLFAPGATRFSNEYGRIEGDLCVA